MYDDRPRGQVSKSYDYLITVAILVVLIVAIVRLR